LIASNVQPSKPDLWLVVLCGALFKAFNLSLDRYNRYIQFLERGQIPPKELLQIQDQISLIYNDIKYSFIVSKSGPNTFSLKLQKDTANPAKVIEAEIRGLGDGGLLIFLNGRSYSCYGTETVNGLK
jgi:acetyl-CoA carboxylase/biotin carboxylase 1